MSGIDYRKYEEINTDTMREVTLKELKYNYKDGTKVFADETYRDDDFQSGWYELKGRRLIGDIKK